MATTCSINALGSHCRVGSFPSAVARVKTDEKLSSTKSQRLALARSLALKSVLLQRGPRCVHHAFNHSAGIFENFKGLSTSHKGQGQERLVCATLDADLSDEVSGQGKVIKPLEVALAGVSLVALDKGTALALNRWEALPAALRGLPSSTVCMVVIIAGLIAVDRADPSVSKHITQFFGPAVEILQRWIPLFYTPALVMFSLAAQKMVLEEGVRLLTLVAGGWVVTIAGVALLASLVRRGVPTQLGNAPNMPSAAAYSVWEILTWAGVGAASGLVAYLAPNAFGFHQASVAAPFFICATVAGFLLGSQVPAPFKKFLHPSITAAIFVNFIAFLAGILTNRSFESVIGTYVTKNLQAPGGGDILLAFLGPLTLSYAFTLFRQRSILRHHATELATVVPIAAIFSLLITILGGRQLGLHETLTRSVAARSTTLAFAIPITNTIGGDEAIAATAAVVTGLLGANLSLRILSALKVEDGVVRALATACSGHGFGSASVASGESDLMPFCLVSYILMGAICSVAVSIPVVRTSLLQL